jgi:nickel-dependent lactate racemase
VGKGDDGQLKIRGLYIGDDAECFEQAAELSLKVNFTMVEKPLKKVVVYLDPEEFKSTWLGNKSIYRTRMAIADNGELIVLAPALKEFGEDKQIDLLIRKYGYRTTPEVLQFTRENDDLRNNLSAAAHLIHGSSENRFSVTYCPGHLTRQEIESVNFCYANLEEMLKRYNPAELKDGFNTLPDGEEIFYISNPALGLWASRDRFYE